MFLIGSVVVIVERLKRLPDQNSGKVKHIAVVAIAEKKQFNDKQRMEKADQKRENSALGLEQKSDVLIQEIKTIETMANGASQCVMSGRTVMNPFSAIWVGVRMGLCLIEPTICADMNPATVVGQQY